MKEAEQWNGMKGERVAYYDYIVRKYQTVIDNIREIEIKNENKK